ncbi:MAG: class II aldolase/adducin family protein, partial [Clostridia bacterium]|nr:class II aldolase/adducin family protein [Clostridia bacterium]
IWGQHGIYGCGKDLDEAFGLIETVEKAAQLYMMTAHLPRVNTITDPDLVEIVKAFKLEDVYRRDFLNL